MDFNTTALDLIRIQRRATAQGNPYLARAELRQVLRPVRTLAAPPAAAPDAAHPDMPAMLIAYLDATIDAESGDEQSHEVADELHGMISGQDKDEGAAIDSETAKMLSSLPESVTMITLDTGAAGTWQRVPRGQKSPISGRTIRSDNAWYDPTNRRLVYAAPGQQRQPSQQGQQPQQQAPQGQQQAPQGQQPQGQMTSAQHQAQQIANNIAAHASGQPGGITPTKEHYRKLIELAPQLPMEQRVSIRNTVLSAFGENAAHKEMMANALRDHIKAKIAKMGPQGDDPFVRAEGSVFGKDDLRLVRKSGEVEKAQPDQSQSPASPPPAPPSPAQADDYHTSANKWVDLAKKAGVDPAVMMHHELQLQGAGESSHDDRFRQAFSNAIKDKAGQEASPNFRTPLRSAAVNNERFGGMADDQLEKMSKGHKDYPASVDLQREAGRELARRKIMNGNKPAAAQGKQPLYDAISNHEKAIAEYKKAHQSGDESARNVAMNKVLDSLQKVKDSSGNKPTQPAATQPEFPEAKKDAAYAESRKTNMPSPPPAPANTAGAAGVAKPKDDRHNPDLDAAFSEPASQPAPAPAKGERHNPDLDAVFGEPVPEAELNEIKERNARQQPLPAKPPEAGKHGPMPEGGQTTLRDLQDQQNRFTPLEGKGGDVEIDKPEARPEPEAKPIASRMQTAKANYEKQHPGKNFEERIAQAQTPEDKERVLDNFAPNHELDVKDALEAGKEVPPEVLADYPKLAKKYGKSPAKNNGEGVFAPENKPAEAANIDEAMKPSDAPQQKQLPTPEPEPKKQPTLAEIVKQEARERRKAHNDHVEAHNAMLKHAREHINLGNGSKLTKKNIDRHDDWDAFPDFEDVAHSMGSYTHRDSGFFEHPKGDQTEHSYVQQLWDHLKKGDLPRKTQDEAEREVLDEYKNKNAEHGGDNVFAAIGQNHTKKHGELSDQMKQAEEQFSKEMENAKQHPDRPAVEAAVRDGEEAGHVQEPADSLGEDYGDAQDGNGEPEGDISFDPAEFDSGGDGKEVEPKGPASPFEQFGHDKKAAESAGWKFESDEKGYNGNRPRYYAVSPSGDRFVWNNNMRHGGGDPWDLVSKGQEVERRKVMSEPLGKRSASAKSAMDTIAKAKQERRDAYKRASADAKASLDRFGEHAKGIDEDHGNLAWDSNKHHAYNDLEEAAMELPDAETHADRLELLDAIVEHATAAKQIDQSADETPEEAKDPEWQEQKKENIRRLDAILAKAKSARSELDDYANNRKEMKAIKEGRTVPAKAKPESEKEEPKPSQGSLFAHKAGGSVADRARNLLEAARKIKKPEPANTSPHHDTVDKWLSDESNTSIAPHAKERIGRALKSTLSRMHPKAADMAMKNMAAPAKFYNSVHHLTQEYNNESARLGEKPESGIVAGFYALQKEGDFAGKGQLHLDYSRSGDESDAMETHAHEIFHAIDGHDTFSGTPEWQDAFKSEIDLEDSPLSDYARVHPCEGFAEFGRLTVVDKEYARDMFPKAWAFFQNKGLV